MKALILVDLQNDFMPGGPLGVPEADLVIPIANQLMERGGFDLVVATQDFHPPDHGSFAANHEGKEPGEVIDLNGLTQVLWPIHCVQQTEGVELVEGLDREQINRIFPKGTDKEVDSYSGFFDNGKRNATGLGDYLKDQKVVEVYVLGVATDYCVKYTALDAVSLGFKTFLIKDACRGVNLNPHDVEKALEEMRMEGIEIISESKKLVIERISD